MPRKNVLNFIQVILFVMLLMFISSCNRGSDLIIKEDPGTPFDPGKDLVVKDFEPKVGSIGTRLVIYGENFGNDTAKVSVTVGGMPAKVISVKGPALLCMVPSKAYNGDVKVAVLNENNEVIKSAVCLDNQGDTLKFDYKFNWTATTFLGQKYENNTKFDVKEGPFDDCGAFDGILWMKFDPQNRDHLYWVGGNNKATRLVDFSKNYVSIVTTNIVNCNSMDFTLDGDMVIAEYQGNLTRTGLWIFKRNSDGSFEPKEALCNAQNVTFVATHPKTGKLYFSPRNAGQIWSIDPKTGEGHYSSDDYEVKLNYAQTTVHLVWHPTGDYAYVIYEGKSMIHRTTVGSDGKLTPPIIVAGGDTQHRWIDGVGTSARMWTPRQGVFVKNPDYEGEEDEYDYYYCDQNSNSVRILTPKGRLSTFAGRGGGIPNGETNGAAGYRDGELRSEAQFNQPMCIAYREDGMNSSFFIGDQNNNYIRRIAPED